MGHQGLRTGSSAVGSPAQGLAIPWEPSQCQDWDQMGSQSLVADGAAVSLVSTLSQPKLQGGEQPAQTGLVLGLPAHTLSSTATPRKLPDGRELRRTNGCQTATSLAHIKR